jgi:serine/threonine-protein kinase
MDLQSRLRAGLGSTYRVERELGRGGMATVFLARDLRHGRDVALKVLRPDLSAVVGADRFFQEIRVTAGLQHPHILTLIDSGEVPAGADGPGLLYYVMPFVDGESLRQRLTREGPLELEEALRLTQAIASALHSAHQLGIIHRDIKPENILLSHGEPVVADFGIALAISSAGRERLTETGLSLGTPAYMSPEQASAAARLDGRSDQYSLACVLYEMLAGEPPYTGPTAQAIIAKRFSEPVPHLGTLRQVPEAVESAITRALAKAPADRFGSLADFSAALRQKPQRFKPTRRMAALLGGLAVLAAIGMLAFELRPARPPAPMVTRQVTFSGKASEPALSPDGRAFVYVAGGRSLVLQRIDGGEPLVLVQPARFLFTPRWTGDGKAIVFIMFRDTTGLAATYMVPSSGGSARKVVDDITDFDAGPDSTILVHAPREKHRFDFLDLRTGAVQRTVTLPADMGDAGEMAWSPDRSMVAFAADGALWLLRAAGGTPTRLGKGGSVRWADGSDAVFFLDGPPGGEAVFKVTVDRRAAAPRGQPVRIAPLPGAASFDVQGSTLVYDLARNEAQTRVLELLESPRRVAEDRALTEGTAQVTGATISPDGEWVAVTETRGGDESISLVPFAGGSRRLLAKGHAEAPAWSPSGDRVAFVREDSTGRGVVVVDVATGASQRVGSTAGPGHYTQFPSLRWSADGNHLAYFSMDLRRIVVVDLANQSENMFPIPDSLGTGYYAVVPSPDGKEVVASTLKRDTDWGQLWKGAAGGKVWTHTPEPFGESAPIAWHPDGWVYFQNTRGQRTDYGGFQSELWRVRGLDRAPELFVAVPDDCSIADLSADARRMACWSRRHEGDVYLATGFNPNP